MRKSAVPADGAEVSGPEGLARPTMGKTDDQRDVRRGIQRSLPGSKNRERATSFGARVDLAPRCSLERRFIVYAPKKQSALRRGIFILDCGQRTSTPRSRRKRCESEKSIKTKNKKMVKSREQSRGYLSALLLRGSLSRSH